MLQFWLHNYSLAYKNIKNYWNVGYVVNNGTFMYAKHGTLRGRIPANTLTLGLCWANVIVYIGNWLQPNIGPEPIWNSGPTFSQRRWPNG